MITLKHKIKTKILNILGITYLKAPEKTWRTRRGMIMRYPPGQLGGTTVVQRIWGVFESRVFEQVSKIVKPGMTIMNLGACYGDYTIFMAQLTGPSGLVYAFEPLPYFFDLLQQNIALNGLEQRIIAVNKALDNKSGHIKVKSQLTDIYEPFRQIKDMNFPSPSGSRIGCQFLIAKKDTSISVIRLSDYIKQNRVNPDLILMDIEGFELAVLEDLTTDIGNKLYTPIIVVEAHDQLFSSQKSYWKHITTFMNRCKYQITPIDRIHYVLQPQEHNKY